MATVRDKMSRREALAMLGAAGAFGLAGRGGGGGVNTSMAVETASGSLSRDGRDRGGAMKTVGVLGGFGPQATMDFEARVQSAGSRAPPLLLAFG